MSIGWDISYASGLLGKHRDTLTRWVNESELQPVRVEERSGNARDIKYYKEIDLINLYCANKSPAINLSEDDEELLTQDDLRKKNLYEDWRTKKRNNDIDQGLVAPKSVLTLTLARFAQQAKRRLGTFTGELKLAEPDITGRGLERAQLVADDLSNYLYELPEHLEKLCAGHAGGAAHAEGEETQEPD